MIFTKMRNFKQATSKFHSQTAPSWKKKTVHIEILSAFFFWGGGVNINNNTKPPTQRNLEAIVREDSDSDSPASPPKEFRWTSKHVASISAMARRVAMPCVDQLPGYHRPGSMDCIRCNYFFLVLPTPSMYGIFTYIWLIFYGKCR